MAKFSTADYEHIYRLNADLLTLARQGNWDAFIPLAEQYVTAVSDIIENSPAEMMAQDEERLISLFKSLLSNEDEIEQALRQRLQFLRKDMSSLHNGKKCSEAYARQFTSVRH